MRRNRAAVHRSFAATRGTKERPAGSAAAFPDTGGAPRESWRRPVVPGPTRGKRPKVVTYEPSVSEHEPERQLNVPRVVHLIQSHDARRGRGQARARDIELRRVREIEGLRLEPQPEPFMQRE